MPRFYCDHKARPVAQRLVSGMPLFPAFRCSMALWVGARWVYPFTRMSMAIVMPVSPDPPGMDRSEIAVATHQAAVVQPVSGEWISTGLID